MCSGIKYRGFRRLRAWLEQHFRSSNSWDLAVPPDGTTWRANPYRQRLLNENVRHNNDDVSEELTGLLFVVSRSGTVSNFDKLSTRRVAAVAVKQHVVVTHIAHLSARVSACTAGLETGCLPCRSSHHHSNTMRVKSASRQGAVSQNLVQARRVGSHALGARYTAFSMIPGNGYRVRRRRFAEARSASIHGGSTIGGSISGGCIKGGSNIRLVSIATLSVSFSMIVSEPS